MTNWRPRNESAEDLLHENGAARRIEQAWRCELVKLSESLYGLDWALCRGPRLCGFAEYKYRMRRYDTVLLSLAKARALNQCATPRMFVAFIVEWPDAGLHYARAPFDVRSPVLGGNDRGQNGDKEPVILIPVRQFRRIGP